MTEDLIPDGKTRLLLVEGRDDRLFFSFLIEHLGEELQRSSVIEQLATQSYDGKDNLARSLGLVVNHRNFKDLTHIGIVRDSDFGTDAFSSVRSAIKQCNRRLQNKPLPIPEHVMDVTDVTDGAPQVLVLTLPLHNDGSLESIVLDALEQDKIMPCVDNYFRCISLKNPSADFARARMPKSRLAVLIAGKAADRSQASSADVKRRLIHNVYKMTWLPADFWNHSSFNDAKHFMRKLLLA